MKRQIFLIKVNPEDWVCGEKEHNWDDLEVGAVVSFDCDCNIKNDIKEIKLHDIFLGYNMNEHNQHKERNKSIVCIGRIISDGCFISVHNDNKERDSPKRFLVQKVFRLRNQLALDWLKEKNIKLGINQDTVVKLEDKDWEIIEQEISKEPDIKNILGKLKESWSYINAYPNN